MRSALRDRDIRLRRSLRPGLETGLGGRGRFAMSKTSFGGAMRREATLGWPRRMPRSLRGGESGVRAAASAEGRCFAQALMRLQEEVEVRGVGGGPQHPLPAGAGQT